MPLIADVWDAGILGVWVCVLFLLLNLVAIMMSPRADRIITTRIVDALEDVAVNVSRMLDECDRARPIDVRSANAFRATIRSMAENSYRVLWKAHKEAKSMMGTPKRCKR